jgi:hypothetical protein
MGDNVVVDYFPAISDPFIMMSVECQDCQHHINVSGPNLVPHVN